MKVPTMEERNRQHRNVGMLQISKLADDDVVMEGKKTSAYFIRMGWPLGVKSGGEFSSAGKV